MFFDLRDAVAEYVAGQYSWVAVLAPPSVARGLSYVTGWFMLTGEFSWLFVCEEVQPK